MSIHVLLLVWMGLILSAKETPQPEESAEFYGKAVVSKVLRIDQTCTLYCDIQDFPPVIGQNMPVKINGLKASENIQFNQKIQKFLNTLLLPEKNQTPPTVTLENIQRGDTFCFCADVVIDGNDLCDLLVENGLAQKIIEVKTPLLPQPHIQPIPQSTIQASSKTGYIGSKTSKIFHRSGCSHAKRIDPAKAANFTTRDEAMRAGRQPCKTCNP